MNLPRCPCCNTRVVQKSMDGKVRIRTNCVVFSEDGTGAICKKCGAEVPLDMELGESLQRALTGTSPRLVVRNSS